MTDYELSQTTLRSILASSMLDLHAELVLAHEALLDHAAMLVRVLDDDELSSA
jgi:hypothetical protein